MLYKLLDKYKEITIKQKKAIEEQDIDLLDSLVDQKGTIITEVESYVDSEEEPNIDTKEIVLKIMQLEAENIRNLKKSQYDIRLEIEKIKQRQQGLSSYRKTTNFIDSV